MICPNCNFQNTNDAYVCRNCGYDFKSAGNTATVKVRNPKVLFESLIFYIMASAVSLEVLFSFFSILAGESNYTAVLSFFGFDSLFKPILNLFGGSDILINILKLAPEALLCIGIWSLPANLKQNRKKPLFLVYISVYIKYFSVIVYCVFTIIMLINSVFGTAKYAENYISAALIFLTVAVAFFTFGYVVYNRILIKILKTAEKSFKNPKFAKINIKFVSTVLIAFKVIGVLACFDCKALKIVSEFFGVIFIASLLMLMRTFSIMLAPRLRVEAEKENNNGNNSNNKVKSNTTKKVFVNQKKAAKPYIPIETEQLSFAIPNKSKKYCSKCGEMISEDLTYCPFCHANQDSSSQVHFKF